MSIRKCLILSAVGFIATTYTTAFAGGPDQAPVQSLYTPAIYVDAHGGYSFYNWNSLIGTNTGTIWFSQGSTTKNNQGGGVGGLDIGVQIFKNVAFEVGSFYLPRVEGVANASSNPSVPSCVASNGVCSSNGEQWNWMVYAAGRFDIPMPYVDGLNVFAKVGPQWRGMSNGGQTVLGNGGMRDYWTVVFGAGADYAIRQSGFRVGMQWLHIPGHISGTSNGGPNTQTNHEELATIQPTQNLLTASVGYKYDF